MRPGAAGAGRRRCRKGARRDRVPIATLRTHGTSGRLKPAVRACQSSSSVLLAARSRLFARGPAGAGTPRPGIPCDQVLPRRLPRRHREGRDRFKHDNGANGNKLLPETMGSGAAWLDSTATESSTLLLVDGVRRRDACCSRGRPDGTFEGRSQDARPRAASALRAWVLRRGLRRRLTTTTSTSPRVGRNNCLRTPRRSPTSRTSRCRRRRLARPQRRRAPRLVDRLALVRLRPRRRPRPLRRRLRRVDARDRHLHDARRRHEGVHDARPLHGAARCACTATRATARSTDVTEAAGLLPHLGKGLGIAMWDFDGERISRHRGRERHAAELRVPEPGRRHLRGRRPRDAHRLRRERPRARGHGHRHRGLRERRRAAASRSGTSRASRCRSTARRRTGSSPPRSRRASPRRRRRPLTFGVAFADMDLDGIQDLVVVNGHIEPDIARINREQSHAQSALLFLGMPGGRFADATASAGPDFAKPRVGRGLAIARLRPGRRPRSPDHGERRAGHAPPEPADAGRARALAARGPEGRRQEHARDRRADHAEGRRKDADPARPHRLVLPEPERRLPDLRPRSRRPRSTSSACVGLAAPSASTPSSASIARSR